jgi:hypothetical protein
VIGKGYFVLQAATLLKLAQTTTDPKVWAALVEKAAELNSQGMSRFLLKIAQQAFSVAEPMRPWRAVQGWG